MIEIVPGLSIDERDIDLKFIHAAGPGGQNVNKVATAVQLRFDVRGARGLPDELKARLISLAGKRMSRDGTLILTARQYRSQERNRQAALARLVALLRAAAVPLEPRHRTRTPTAQRRKRLEGKRKRALVKRRRQSPAED